MIHDNVNGSAGALQVVLPDTESFENGQESLVMGVIVLCCLSLGVHLAPISLSLPYSHPIVLFIPQITLCFHLSQIPWSPCDPYALPLPCVLLLLIFSIYYSSFLVYISNPSPYALLISVLLIFHCLLIYPLPCLLLISNPHFQYYKSPSSYL